MSTLPTRLRDDLRLRLAAFYCIFTRFKDVGQSIFSAEEPSPELLQFVELGMNDPRVLHWEIVKETEANWKVRETAIQEQRAFLSSVGEQLRADASEDDSLGELIFNHLTGPLCAALLSLRTTVALAACSLVSELYAKLPATASQEHTQEVIATLLKVAGQAKKITANAAIESLKVVAANCVFTDTVLETLSARLNEKSVGAGAKAVAVFIEAHLNLHSEHNSNAIETRDNDFLNQLSPLIERLLSDADGDVRSAGRRAFLTFQLLLPDTAKVMYDSLDVSVRKALVRDAKARNMMLLGAEAIDTFAQAKPSSRPPGARRSSIQEFLNQRKSAAQSQKTSSDTIAIVSVTGLVNSEQSRHSLSPAAESSAKRQKTIHEESTN